MNLALLCLFMIVVACTPTSPRVNCLPDTIRSRADGKLYNIWCGPEKPVATIDCPRPDTLIGENCR